MYYQTSSSTQVNLTKGFCQGKHCLPWQNPWQLPTAEVNLESWYMTLLVHKNMVVHHSLRQKRTN